MKPIRILELESPASRQEVVVEREQQLTVFVPLQNVEGEHVVRVILSGQGASATIRGAGVMTGGQKLKLTIDTIHEAPNTTGSTLVKAVLQGASQLDFSGLIKILPAAQGSNDFLQQDSLLLSDEASANAVPGLEIEANEVKASHAATAAPVNQEQLFYLRSRGIPEVIATQLVAEAFLAPAMSGLDEPTREMILKALNAK